MAARELPLHFQALLADPATPLSDRTATLLHRDLQRWTRRYLQPLARVMSRISIWAIVALKRVLPFQFSSHDALDRLCVWFLRRCVSREAGELLLRHFVVENVLIGFVARNSGLPQVPEPDLMPTKLDALFGHAVIRHDINMYRMVIDLGRKLRETGRFRLETVPAPDYSMLDVPPIAADPESARIIELDLTTALYLMSVPFALLTTEDIYEQAVNSFQLDESMLAHLGDITGDPIFRSWGSRQSLAWLDIGRDVPHALTVHALLHEYAHTHLCRLAAQSAVTRGVAA